ncbi:hypothetical protein [Aquimarina sp. MMG016]|uniref:hypothetical protein n=1 Tax=Aquimarina sp. MMG016 TaxID=2822690 RepID=UPI001B3A4DBA|nr:hypothetical protein [Aquimarina sp. MMG016]MBQ4820341.1 hypothetical protein [Aquimarina sp. MMG016]
MYKTIKNDNLVKNEEIEGVYRLIEKNMDCTKKVIKHIDVLIENRLYPESAFKSLTSLRNVCAINVMNLLKAAG